MTESEKKLLILDVDGTLVHVTENEPVSCRPPDHTFYIGHCVFRLWKRPFLDQFLQWCFTHYRVAVWSAGVRVYVESILSLILPADASLQFVWCREKCTMLSKMYHYMAGPPLIHQVKQLKKVWRRKKYSREDVLILDDTSSTYARNFGNAVPIQSYDPRLDNDTEFHRVGQLLEKLSTYSNVTRVEKRPEYPHYGEAWAFSEFV